MEFHRQPQRSDNANDVARRLSYNEKKQWSTGSVDHLPLDIVAFPETTPRNATADLVDARQREDLFAKFPHIDILVNSMGIYEIMSYEDIDDAVWENYFRTNVLAANALTKFYYVMPSGQMPQYGVRPKRNTL